MKKLTLFGMLALNLMSTGVYAATICGELESTRTTYYLVEDDGTRWILVGGVAAEQQIDNVRSGQACIQGSVTVKDGRRNVFNALGARRRRSK